MSIGANPARRFGFSLSKNATFVNIHLILERLPKKNIISDKNIKQKVHHPLNLRKHHHKKLQLYKRLDNNNFIKFTFT